jgi:hypothetical protein
MIEAVFPRTGAEYKVFLSSPGAVALLCAGTYKVSLSTISTNINSLSSTNFDSNLGANNTVFCYGCPIRPSASYGILYRRAI